MKPLISQNSHIRRLFKHLLELETKENVCVFFNMSGHVNSITITVADSEDHYGRELYGTEINYAAIVSKWNDGREYLSKRDWKEFVDDIILDIEDAIKDREAKVEKIKAETEKSERATLERLKAKYEKV